MRFFYAFAISAALAASGCATQPALPPPTFSGLEQSNSVVIKDMRPTIESEKEIFSLLITSSAYGIYRVADSATNPTGPRLLTHRAYEAFPALATKPAINVMHFVTYANLQSHLRKGSLGAAFGGPIGATLMTRSSPPAGQVLTTKIDSALLDQTEKEEHVRAYYSEEENPEKSPVNLIYIDAEILGQRVASRCLVPPLADKPHLFLVEAFDMCIAKHLALYDPERLHVATSPK
ncbi:hypothetical protein EA797_20640 [Stutzerimonas zhaodongensis]|uniref:Lipoprotein n=1 Tax=Stutzerimonas zhaodongensis TaxID=1176257 RepID=A0A3M2HD87_9GAMM|nr:hypothetical protein [Stutzerimonas zhaodongensis]MCQ4317825.1 hypothetical protein [Stutzerimonas zhaodongensis]RMH87661.1 hypothetical protein EA797_20640 [Stutzerimonas zhaodongensis]